MAYIGNGPGSIRQGRRAVYEFTSTANQTAYSGVDANGLTLDLLQANSNDVFLNGVRLIITDDYTVSGDVLTLVSGAASGDKLIVTTQDEIGNTASYSKAASDSRYVNYDGDVVNGTIQMGGSGNNITFADNNKAIFGAGSDLQIYHDGTRSYVDDAGAGSLWLRGGDVAIKSTASETMADFANNGAVTLYHNNAAKIATASGGVTVTGTATATTFQANAGGTFTTASGNDLNIVVPDGRSLFVKEGSTTHLTVDNTGNVGVGTTGTIGASSSGHMMIKGSAAGHKGLKLGSAEILPVTNSGGVDNGSTNLGSAASRFNEVYLSGGVFLGGTGTANKLSDYEQGYYTPTVTSNGGSITLNTSYNTGAYTKVGRSVTVTGLLVASAISSPSGYLEISLPFASANLVEGSERSTNVVTFWCNGTGVPNGNVWYNAMLILNLGGVSYLRVYMQGYNGTYQTSPANWIGAGTDMHINFTYFTA